MLTFKKQQGHDTRFKRCKNISGRQDATVDSCHRFSYNEKPALS